MLIKIAVENHVNFELHFTYTLNILYLISIVLK